MNLLQSLNPAHPQGTNDHLVNKVHHSDAMELMAAVGDASIDMVLCDLPYG